MKKLIQLKLKILAKMILAKYRPAVIGITGSVGKTSAKEAICAVLSKKFRVRQSMGNYNNEIGVPLTIIGMNSPGKSIPGWCNVFGRACKMILIKDKNYPQILVLEMGVDRPGDMKYLNGLVRCKIGVITLIGPVHLEFFGTVNKIQEEKGKLIKCLPKEGWAILNYDNEKTRQIREMSKARVLTYGFDEKADVRAREVNFASNSFSSRGNGCGDIENLSGISFKLGYGGSFAPVFLPRVVGNSAVYAALAGAAVGLAYGMNLAEIADALREFDLPRGRMKLIPGIKHTLVIDDTYNSSPQSSMAALDVLKIMPTQKGARKFAVLGDMMELGSYSERGHREVGKRVAKGNINKLIVVGERARDIARGAKEAGMSRDNVFHFDNAETAGRFIQKRIREKDLILVKGSQAVRMEKIVKEIMAEPLRADELLVRQGQEWKK